MRKLTVRACLAFLVVSLLALPVLNVSRASAEDFPDWQKVKTTHNVYCDEGAASVFRNYCSGNILASNSESSERYIDITMHSSEYGHFESGEEDITVNYFRGDAFEEYVRPISDRDNYVFLGWSTSSEAKTVDIEIGATTASMIGSDIYPVWTNKAYVYYYVVNGYWSPDGGESTYESVLMEYDANAHFQPLVPDPQPREKYYDFDGWYTEMFGSGEKYTSETLVNTPEIDLFSNWVYNPAKVDDELVLNESTHIVAGVSIPVYKFTPSETAYYEVYSEGLEDDGSGNQAIIRIQDGDDHTLAMEKPVVPGNPKANVHTFYKMQAGETYYVRFGEMDGNYISFDATIKKADMANVIFHANQGENAWFDGDHNVKTKTIPLPVGDNIYRYLNSGLEYNDTSVSFIGWSPEENPEKVHNSLIIEGDMDVYGFWDEYETVFLDYNGGYDPIAGEDVTGTVFKYHDGEPFATPIDPKISNSHLKFIGWSRDRNATEPDADIIETVTPGATFKDQTLYAVYGEKLLETFIVTDGGYMMDNPAITTYQASAGTGHIFYGMAVMHDNPKMKAIGWMDQDGVFVNAVSEIDPYYHVTKDSTFTVVWGYEVTAYAAEGSFEKTGAQVARLRMPYENGDGTFSYDAVKELVGDPIPLTPDRYFIGWASDPDLNEPDVIDGVTRLEDLESIYGLWGDEEYAFSEGENATWAENSSNELRMVIKREHDDRYTYDFFNKLMIDGEEVSEDNYDKEKGSLVLTLHNDYLNTLGRGEHQASLVFMSASSSTLELNTTITITGPTEEDDEDDDDVIVPDTGIFAGEKSGGIVVGVTGIVLIGIFALVIIVKLKYKKVSRLFCQ